MSDLLVPPVICTKVCRFVPSYRQIWPSTRAVMDPWAACRLLSAYDASVPIGLVVALVL